MLDKMRDNAQSWVIKVLFGIIILAFIFAFSGAGGGSGDQVLAFVNGDPITVPEFERALSNQDDTSVETRVRLFSALVHNEILRQIGEKNGILITDAELQAYIRSIPGFSDENGQFDMTRYRSLVGDTEAFENGNRDELLKQKIGRFLALPAKPVESEIRALFEWQNEQTTLEYTLIPLANYLARAIIDPAEVQAYYDDNAFLFQQPERSVFKLLTFTPATLADTSQVEEADIASYYEAFSANLNMPRTISYYEIVLPVGANPTQQSVDDAAAKAAVVLEDLAAGISFEDLAATNARPGDMTPGELKVAAVEDLSPGIVGALAGLDMGGISQPTFTTDGLTIIKLINDEPSRPLTLDEAREEITTRIAEEQALDKMDDKVEEAISALAQGQDMEQAADTIGMTLVTTKAMTSDEFKAEYSISAEDAIDLFALQTGTVPSSPMRLDHGYLLASRSEIIPAMTMPLEDVRAEITAKMILEESRRLADIDAQSILAGQIEDYELIASQPFTRSGPAPLPGVDAQLLKDAFTTAAGEWLPKPYAVAEGFLVAKAGERIEPSEAKWFEQRDSWLTTAGEITRRELNMAFQSHVFLAADNNDAIEIVRDDLLQ